ncbi:MAG: hypothetical protein U0570_12500 [Phycisphaerales bacterium]
MNTGTRRVGSVAGWSLLGVVAVVAAAVSTWSNASIDASLDGPANPAVAETKGVGAWSKGVSKRTVSLITDGNVLVDFRKKTDEPVTSRFVAKLISRTFTPPDNSTEPPTPARKTSYNALVTQNQAGRGGQVIYNRATRLDPDPNKDPSEDSSEMATAVPDDGIVVVYGMAPIVVCRKATIAAAGTAFAIESVRTGSGANDGYWLVYVLESQSSPVEIWFEGSRARKTIGAGECLRYPFSATAIGDSTSIPSTDPQSSDLAAYATGLMNSINP